jgi:cell division protein FtsB
MLTAVVLLLGAAGVVPAKQYLAQRDRIADLEVQIRALTAERGRLQHRVDRLRDPAELERLARECLGMVKPGEIAFVGVSEGGAPLPSDC